MTDLSIVLYTAEKSYTFPFKDTNLDSALLNPSNILLKKVELES